MLGKVRRRLKKRCVSRRLPSKGDLKDGSSSEDDPENAYVNLVSLVRKTEESSSSSDTDETVGNPKQAKLSPISTSAGNFPNSGEQPVSHGVNRDSESDCLAEHSESDLEIDESNPLQTFEFTEEDEHVCHPETDFFKQHFESPIINSYKVMKCKPLFIKCLQWSQLQSLRHISRKSSWNSSMLENVFTRNINSAELKSIFHVRKSLADKWIMVNNCDVKDDGGQIFTPLQRELFVLFNNYVDVCYSSNDALKNFDSIQKTYCLHIANHVIRSRAKVLLNTARLKQLTPEQQEEAECRDQGLTRPKVLILLPFKHTALKIMKTFLELFKRGKKFEVGYKNRFFEEFGDDGTNRPALEDMPDDYQNLFAGNTDEHFRIGVALLRNSVRLYAPFYSSDIIIASPLGLRTVIGAKGEKHYEHDFLSSIEILVMDHTDVFLMQNWEHVLHIFEHLNLTPKDSHGVDFSRVRNFSLDGQSKYFRQTISISSLAMPQIASLFSKSWNYKGYFTAEDHYEKGSICAIAKQLPQMFHKLQPVNLVESAETRFKFFVDCIYKQYRDLMADHVVIYVPQYFDFVRLRNFMRKEWKSGSGPIFAHINDYSTPTEAGKAKRRFFTGKCPMMLYTERFHFYHRTRLRGVKTLIFYELPTYPQFYAELCNMVREKDDNSSGISNSRSIVVLYSKYETHKLMATVGLNRCKELQSSSKSNHMFVTSITS